MIRLKLKVFVFISILFLAYLPAQSQDSNTIRLNTGWEFLRSDLGGVWEAVRPVEEGRPETVPVWQQVNLPHSFNAFDAVDPDVNYYQGPGWYRTSIEVNNPYKQGRTILHFEGAGQKTEVYVYTTKVGSHVGGYDEWSVDITEAVEAFKKTVQSQGFPCDVLVGIAVLVFEPVVQVHHHVVHGAVHAEDLLHYQECSSWNQRVIDFLNDGLAVVDGDELQCQNRHHETSPHFGESRSKIHRADLHLSSRDFGSEALSGRHEHRLTNLYPDIPI